MSSDKKQQQQPFLSPFNFLFCSVALLSFFLIVILLSLIMRQWKPVIPFPTSLSFLSILSPSSYPAATGSDVSQVARELWSFPSESWLYKRCYIFSFKAGGSSLSILLIFQKALYCSLFFLYTYFSVGIFPRLEGEKMNPESKWNCQ